MIISPNESEIEQKQQYLRKEIVEQNYNQEEFSQYLSTVKGEDEVNLENWTMDELKNAVSNFKSSHNPISQEIENTKDNNLNENSNNENTNNNNLNQNNEQEGIAPKEIDFNASPLIEYEKIIKTKTLEPNQISHLENLNVTISEPTYHKSGLLSGYYQYTMKTTPIGYTVYRKVSDYTFLNGILPKINNLYFNPLLPPFQHGLKDDSTKKMLYIENYMNSIVENEYYRSLPIVLQFLNLPQDKWEKERQNYSKLKVNSVEDIPTLENSFHIQINKKEDGKGMKIKDYNNRKTKVYEDLNNAMDELLLTKDKLVYKYKALVAAFIELDNCHKDNKKLNLCPNKILLF